MVGFRLKRVLSLTAAGLVLAHLACNGLPPIPQPPPIPPPPPWECPLQVPGCHQTVPPQTCSTEESPCWHNPTQDPEHCELAPDCGAPPPDPPPPPPTGCVTESDLVLIDCPTPGAKFQDEVKKATDTLGDLRGRPPNENLDRVAALLRVQMPGRCTLSGIEALFTQRDDGSYEENHAVFFGNGGWTNSGRGVFVGCHEDTGVSPPPEACGEPTPPPLSHFRGPAEKECDPGQCCDSTPYVCGVEYCREIGFTDGRRCCSVRTEGAEDRAACERLVTGGGAVWTSDGSVELCNDNHLRAKCRNCSWIQVCDTPGAVCNRKNW